MVQYTTCTEKTTFAKNTHIWNSTICIICLTQKHYEKYYFISPHARVTFARIPTGRRPLRHPPGLRRRVRRADVAATPRHQRRGAAELRRPAVPARLRRDSRPAVGMQRHLMIIHKYGTAALFRVRPKISQLPTCPYIKAWGVVGREGGRTLSHPPGGVGFLGIV